MKCGYEKCDNVMDSTAGDSVMEQGVMRNGVWYCSLAHYEEQLRADWRKRSAVDYQRKCRNLTCFNMKPIHFWEKLKNGEGFEKDGHWYCSAKCYDEDVKRAWQDERDKHISQKLEGRFRKIKLGSLLLQDNAITPEQLEDALEKSKLENKRIGECLLELGYVSEEVMTRMLSKQEGVRKMDLSKITLKPEVLSLINKEQAKKHKALPIEILKRTNTLIVAISDPSDKLSLIDLKYITGYNIEPFIVPESSLRAALKKFYGIADSEFSAKEKEGSDKASKSDVAELKSAANIILSGAKEKGADNFDMYFDGHSVKGSFRYNNADYFVTFKKIVKE